MMFNGISSTKALIDSGKLTALAVTGEKRAATLPNVPTMSEAGFSQVTVSSWWGVFGPANLPHEIVATLDEALSRTLADEQVRKKLDELIIDADYKNNKDPRAFLQAETDRWSAVIRNANIEPE
jgi:tripartite-type tricarboxylate transporter receptor subunit TctC